MRDFTSRCTSRNYNRCVNRWCSPLHAKANSKLQASVDYISHIVRNAIIRMRIGDMQTAHIRGASTSKVVQLVPTAEAAIMKLGRWTTPYTFRNHYQAPVQGTWAEFPTRLQQNTQMILRWGFQPTPPQGVSATDYVKGLPDRDFHRTRQKRSEFGVKKE